MNSDVSVKINGQIFQYETKEDGTFVVEIPNQSPGTTIKVWSVNQKGFKSDVKMLIIKDATATRDTLVDTVTDQTTIITGMTKLLATIIKKSLGFGV